MKSMISHESPLSSVKNVETIYKDSRLALWSLSLGWVAPNFSVPYANSRVTPLTLASPPDFWWASTSISAQPAIPRAIHSVERCLENVKLPLTVRYP